MAITDMHNSERCHHVRLSGQPCKAPARRGTQWCLFHAAEHNEAPLPFSTSLDDAAGIHAAAAQVLFDLQRDCIDFRRASLMLSGLRLMRINLKQLAVDLGEEVSQPPDKRSDHDDLPGPSVAEVVHRVLDQIESETASEKGLPLPKPFDVRQAELEGRLAESAIARLDAFAPDPEATAESESSNADCLRGS